MPISIPMPTLQNRNVALVIFDDLGKDKLAVYGAQPYQPPTPNMTASANAGVRMSIQVNPACSHTRAAGGVGRYGFRTKILGVIDTDDEAPLPVNELLLPEVLELASPGQIDTALIGKYHLANAQNGSWLAPNRAGFKYFAGQKGNIRNDGGSGYFAWQRGVNGRVAIETAYNTTKLVDDALAWINGHSASQPWFLQLAFAAPHTPFDRPSAALYNINAYSAHNPAQPYPLPAATAPSGQEVDYFNATLMALDTEFGRFRAGLNLSNTTVIAIGDNGTTALAVTPPFDPAKSKATPYQLGIDCPLWVEGNGVVTPGRVSTGLVGAVDLFSTICALYGLDPALVLPAGRTIDGLSFKPVLDSAGGASSRTRAYSEQFNVNVRYPATKAEFRNAMRTMRDDEYKLIRQWNFDGNAKPEELYHLTVDPQETVNLLAGTLTAPEQVRYATLTADLNALIASV